MYMLHYAQRYCLIYATSYFSTVDIIVSPYAKLQETFYDVIHRFHGVRL